MKTWYAVMENKTDSDWGFGSYDLNEAKEMLKQQDWTDGYILEIDDETNTAIRTIEI
jgi:hypothetical protein